MVFFAVSALATLLLAAAPASAQPARPGPFCIPEALWLRGMDGDTSCMTAPNPLISPPVAAYSETNGGQNVWCLYTWPNYSGSVVRIPAFTSANVRMSVASARPC
jgi:hypothetical protein